MDKLSFSLIIKTITLTAMILIGIIICNDAVGETEINLSGIDKQKFQKLLTKEEKAWLSNHKTIRIAGPKAFPPFHYYEEDGTLKGMASDYINLIFEYLDIQPDIRSGLEWNIVLKEAEEHKIDLISCTAKSIERESFLLFTDPYLSFPLVIVTKTDSPFIGGINDLHDKNVAFIKGNVTYDWIRRDNIEAIPYYVKSPLEGLKAVSSGNAEAHIENLATASYLIQQHGLANLKIAAPAFSENYNLYIAVRKDWPELVSIINKIFTAITPQLHSAISNRWLSIKFDYGIRKSEVIQWVLGISCISITIFAVILIWNRRLSKEIRERKKTEEALEVSTRRYFELFESSRDGFVLVDAQERFLDANKAYCEMLGYSLDELKVKNDFYAITPEHWRKWEQDEIWCNRLLKTGASGIYEKELIRKDGTTFPVELQKFITKDQQGNPYHLWGIARDITERNRSAKTLRENEKKFRSVFERSPVGIILTDSQSVVLDCNHYFSKIFGAPREKYIGMNLLENIPDGPVRKNLFDSLSDYEIHHYEGPYTSIFTGRQLYLSISSEKVAPDLIISILADISERRRAEEALQESEQHISSILRSAPVGIGLVVNRVLKSVNSRLCEITGYEDQEIIGQSARILYPSDEEFEYVGREKYTQITVRGTGTVETHWLKKDGTVIDILLSSTPMDLNDWSKGVTFTALDITERKKAEAEKLIAQKLAGENEKQALVGQIAGKMAHDFNNILAIIMGNAQLALVNSKEAKTKKTLELIYEQTIRGKNLTRNLVAFAKDQEPKQEFFIISEKIDLVFNLMRKDLEGIELLKEVGPGVPELLADPGMIEHALVNLIQNSIHALSMVEHPRIAIRTYTDENLICFEIEDNGCGISKENLENIYEPSFTLKGSKDVTGSYKSGIKGSGYGMSNVKRYIEQHKGNISVESKLGSGTKITISMPVIKKELTTEEKTEIRKGKASFEKYILLVEDEPAIADVQYTILTQEPCNHRVDIAGKGQVALDLFQRNKYDLVSLDYVLPGGINGMDIYHNIRAVDKTIPILFISGNIEFLESIKELRQKDHYIDHLSKPFKNMDYVNSINKLFETVLI